MLSEKGVIAGAKMCCKYGINNHPLPDFSLTAYETLWPFRQVLYLGDAMLYRDEGNITSCWEKGQKGEGL